MIKYILMAIFAFSSIEGYPSTRKAKGHTTYYNLNESRYNSSAHNLKNQLLAAQNLQANVSHTNSELCELLIKYGPTPIGGAILAEDKHAIEVFLINGMQINQPHDPISPLFLALIHDKVDMAVFLIEKGHIVSESAAYNEPQPIFLAIYACGKNPANLKVIKKILSKKIDPNMRAHRKINECGSKYHITSECAQLTPVQYVLRCIHARQAKHQNADEFRSALSLILDHGGKY
jgi:hypothetical protein